MSPLPINGIGCVNVDINKPKNYEFTLMVIIYNYFYISPLPTHLAVPLDRQTNASQLEYSEMCLIVNNNTTQLYRDAKFPRPKLKDWQVLI